VIKEIVEVSGAKVDINDEGLVRIASQNKESLDTARKMISEIVEDPIVGQVYEGKIVKLMDFGAFVNFYGKRDGLVHVSQISEERVNHPKDVLTEGQNVKVKLMGIDDRGKSKLSMKVINQSTGKEVEKEA
jgi:polyribonucleotide nucleotidyltransferase